MRRSPMTLLPPLLPSLLLLALLPCLAAIAPTPASAGSSTPRAAASSSAPTAAHGVPHLRVRVIARHLDHPWDVATLPDGDLLVTQRDRATLSVVHRGRVRRVRYPSRSVWVSRETGLMGLAVDPDFATTRRIYTCQGGFTGHGRHDVRVLAWRLSDDERRVTSRRQLLGGLPTSTGRHGGCRLLIAADGSLLVGTGDAAQGRNPEDLDSLGGKTLRLDRLTGEPWPTNPYADATGPRRYVQTYGHRNVQGLAQRSDSSLWSIEQGTYRDDEVNLLVDGGDYGYDPVPGYNESVPMTDQSLPGRQLPARWRSGDPTLATSGGTFVPESGWGALGGSLAVACLKAQRVLFLSFDATGHLRRVRTPAPLRRHGRIRTVVTGADGDLLVTTDNGAGRDVLLRVSPR